MGGGILWKYNDQKCKRLSNSSAPNKYNNNKRLIKFIYWFMNFENYLALCYKLHTFSRAAPFLIRYGIILKIIFQVPMRSAKGVRHWFQ